MNTDKELLELAAKAAGYVQPHHYLPKSNSLLWISASGFTAPWNPLNDDGDAMRLAIDMRLKVHVWGDAKEGGIRVNDYIQWCIGDDLYADTRRAIVIAAAEIGKTL